MPITGSISPLAGIRRFAISGAADANTIRGASSVAIAAVALLPRKCRRFIMCETSMSMRERGAQDRACQSDAGPESAHRDSRAHVPFDAVGARPGRGITIAVDTRRVRAGYFAP